MILLLLLLLLLVESVTVAPDGSFVMLDRHGAVRVADVATHSSSSSSSSSDGVPAPQPALKAAALAHLGPGRPLGAQYNAAGNLIICDAFKARQRHRRCALAAHMPLCVTLRSVMLLLVDILRSCTLDVSLFLCHFLCTAFPP